jgi:hypothetical protein
VIGFELDGVFVPGILARQKGLIRTDIERLDDPFIARVPLELDVAAALEERRHRDVIGGAWSGGLCLPA